MKAVDLKNLTEDEIRQLRLDTQKDLFDLRAKKGTGDTSGQPLRVRTVRRDLARIETVIRQREINKHG